MKQQNVYHGGKVVDKCVLRNSSKVAMPVEEEGKKREFQQFNSISQAKHHCLELMRKGFQIRTK